MKKYKLMAFDSAEALATAAATAWLDEVEKANRAQRRHSVALSGGRITNNFLAAALDLAKRRKISFAHVHFFWADERCVPPTDGESNFKIANDLILAPLNIPADGIHRIPGERLPESAAQAAEADLRRIVPQNDTGQPVLDLIFLGLGPDGHAASLFPGEPESLMNSKAVYRAIFNSPKPPPNRVTLGYPAIAAAREVWMLASGSGKEAALRDSLAPDGTTPFARVLQTRSDTKIFTDIALV